MHRLAGSPLGPLIAFTLMCAPACGDGGGGTASTDASRQGDGGDGDATVGGGDGDGDRVGDGDGDGAMDANVGDGSLLDGGGDDPLDAGAQLPVGTPHVFVGSTDGMLRAYVLDPAAGTLSAAGSHDTGGLDFMTTGADPRTLFVASGNLAVFTYDDSADNFSAGGSVSTAGGTHVERDPTGDHVFTASYNDGTIAMHTYSAQAGLSAALELSPGVRAHQVRVSRSGQHVYVPCLGSDYVAQYTLDRGTGQLNFVRNADLPAGTGPRHMDFHPTSPVAYVLGELSSELHVFDVDGTTGVMTRRAADTVATHVDGQSHQSSDVRVTPNGRHLYALNRQPDQLVHFAVEADRSLTRLQTLDLTDDVRSFGLDPAGNYLIAGSRDGQLRLFRIGTDGSLHETDSLTGLGTIHAVSVRYLPD